MYDGNTNRKRKDSKSIEKHRRGKKKNSTAKGTKSQTITEILQQLKCDKNCVPFFVHADKILTWGCLLHGGIGQQLSPVGSLSISRVPHFCKEYGERQVK